MKPSAIQKAEQVSKAIALAVEALEVDHFQWLAWPQTWPDSTCGFGGVAMRAFWEAQTVIATKYDDDPVLVFHAGKYAYTVRKPTNAFWVVCGRYELPGQYEWERDSKLRQKLDSDSMPNAGSTDDIREARRELLEGDCSRSAVARNIVAAVKQQSSVTVQVLSFMVNRGLAYTHSVARSLETLEVLTISNARKVSERIVSMKE